jgi:hypothetical protein
MDTTGRYGAGSRVPGAGACSVERGSLRSKAIGTSLRPGNGADFNLAYGLLFGMFTLQLAVYLLAICYAQVFVARDPYFTGLLRDVGAAAMYLIFALGAFQLSARIIYELVIKGTSLSVRILISSFRDSRSMPSLPPPADASGDILVISDLHLTVPGEGTLQGGKDSQPALDCSYRKEEVVNHLNRLSASQIKSFPAFMSGPDWGVDILILDSNRRPSPPHQCARPRRD